MEILLGARAMGPERNGRQPVLELLDRARYYGKQYIILIVAGPRHAEASRDIDVLVACCAAPLPMCRPPGRFTRPCGKLHPTYKSPSSQARTPVCRRTC